MHITFSVLGWVYDPLVITYAPRTAHATGAGSQARLPWIEIVYALPCADQPRGPASSCSHHDCLPAEQLPTSRLFRANARVLFFHLSSIPPWFPPSPSPVAGKPSRSSGGTSR